MSAPDLTADVMHKFRESGAEKHSTIFLGAGASTTSGLPDWNTFAKRLLVQSGSVPNDAIAELLVSRQDPLLVVEAARVAYNGKWEQKLRTALYEGVNSMEPSPLHRAAVAHLLGGELNDTSLVTLNFDPLLEQAIADETGTMPLSVVDGEYGDDEYVVHHLHGVITPQQTESVVLTLSDFTDVIADPNAWQLSYLQAAVERGALIIAGTSYRDPDVRQWLHHALPEKPSQHAALVLLARQGFALSKSEFSQAQKALSAQWSAIGLESVLLEDHSDAAQIIQELRYIHGHGYLAPQERAVEVWRHHAERFDELQTAYVQQLEVDAAVMKDALGVDRLNLTLWLADGQGNLARWAAQDRVYRDQEMLRSIETGHDSQWIAGQALGLDALLFKDLEVSGLRQWRSVLAIPVPVPHPSLPTFSAAVLTIGLPDAAERFEGSTMLWGSPLARISDEWGERLCSVAFAK